LKALPRILGIKKVFKQKTPLFWPASLSQAQLGEAGGGLLSQGSCPSTISAEGLNF